MKNKKLQLLKLALSFCFFVLLVFGAKAANAATLYFSPSSGNFSVGNIFTVNVLVNTENVTINNAEATINFPSGLLEIVSFSKSGSIFSLWVEEPTFSNSAGTLSFNGGLPTPGFNGTSGKVLSAVFRVKRAGSATVVFSSPAIRANDGYGTNVFRTGLQASYNLVATEEEPSPSLSPMPVPEAPILLRPAITSPTHPDSNKWYSNNNPLFKWDVPSGVSEVTLVLSRRSNSVPFIDYSPPISERQLDDLEEGEWYLNARFRTAAGLGPITSFKFNIDTQSPRLFSITRLDTDDPTNPRPELLFESSDETSGIDHYELTINDGEPLNIAASDAGRVFAMPLQTPGEKELKITAFDRAGNTVSVRLTIQVGSIDAPRLDRVSAEVREGEPLVVEGTAKPNQKVIIHFVEDGNQTYETTADGNDRFTVTITDLPAGEYKIFAKAQDERGAISDPSNIMAVEVRGGVLNLIFRMFDAVINFISTHLILLIILMAVGAIIGQLVTKGIPRLAAEVEKIRFIASEYRTSKKLKRLDSKTKLEFKILQKDIKKELELLNKIASHRSLHPDEQYLRNKLEKYYNILKKL